MTSKGPFQPKVFYDSAIICCLQERVIIVGKGFLTLLHAGCLLEAVDNLRSKA